MEFNNIVVPSFIPSADQRPSWLNSNKLSRTPHNDKHSVCPTKKSDCDIPPHFSESQVNTPTITGSSLSLTSGDSTEISDEAMLDTPPSANSLDEEDDKLDDLLLFESICGGEMRQMVVVKDDKANCIPVIDMQSAFSFSPTIVTQRPKFDSSRVIAICTRGRLVCKSYDQSFGLDFDYSCSVYSPFTDLKGCLLSKLQVKQSEKRFTQFENAAANNEKLNGYIGLKTGRGAVKNVFMELVPLNPTNDPRQDGNLFLLKVSHTTTRGYANSISQYQKKFQGEVFTPIKVTQRKRAVTRKERTSKLPQEHKHLKRSKNCSIMCDRDTNAHQSSLAEAKCMINTIRTPSMADQLKGFLVGGVQNFRMCEETDVEITGHETGDHATPLISSASDYYSKCSSYGIEPNPPVFEL